MSPKHAKLANDNNTKPLCVILDETDSFRTAETVFYRMAYDTTVHSLPMIVVAKANKQFS